MKPRYFVVGLLLVSALALVLWQLNRGREIPAAPATAPVGLAPAPAVGTAVTKSLPAETPAAVAAADPVADLPPRSATSGSSPDTDTLPVAPAAAPPTLSPEAQAEALAATARMYAAHAPLRAPEVADPDSPANKQILSAMVTKILAQPAAKPPAVASPAIQN